MKTIFILIFGVLLSLNSIAAGPPSLVEYNQSPQMNLHLSNSDKNYTDRPKGVKMLLVGAAFIAVGGGLYAVYDYNDAYHARYPYNEWAATSVAAFESVGLLLVVGGLVKIIHVDF